MRQWLLLVGLAGPLSGCFTAQQAPIAASQSRTLTSDEALAVQSRVTDCEWKAANQYDDGRATIAELANRVQGVCAVELTKAALAFGFSPNDPGIQSDQFRQAVENVESARQARTGKRGIPPAAPAR